MFMPGYAMNLWHTMQGKKFSLDVRVFTTSSKKIKHRFYAKVSWLLWWPKGLLLERIEEWYDDSNEHK